MKHKSGFLFFAELLKPDMELKISPKSNKEGILKRDLFWLRDVDDSLIATRSFLD